MINILMIEDDFELAEILSEYLSKFAMNVKNIIDIHEALSLIKSGGFDLVILDLSLPSIDGLDVCLEIRKISDIPIIISSARSDITDKVIGLDRGADDYLPKPYNPRELEARIKSILRRHKKTIEVSPKKELFKLIEQSREIYFNGELLHLTNAEYGILSYLVKKKGVVVSREEILYNVLEISEDSSYKSIDVIIGRIRNKINDVKNPKYLLSVRGIGYKLVS
ncbi:MAG: response regulator transcription factor [Campylobacterales bacterium]|nr:response regulator transcription factor [Campylobacterales bacterium]